MIQKIKATVVAFFQRPKVQSVIRHAVTAAVGVFVAAVAAGGFQSVNVAVIAAAAAAAIRVVWLAVQASFATS